MGGVPAPSGAAVPAPATPGMAGCIGAPAGLAMARTAVTVLAMRPGTPRGRAADFFPRVAARLAAARPR